MMMKEALVSMRLSHIVALVITLGVGHVSARNTRENLSKLTLQIIYFLLYQTVFHPLAKYPGPFLAKISILRAAYKAWQGDLHIDIWQQHQKYGTFFSFPIYLPSSRADEHI